MSKLIFAIHKSLLILENSSFFPFFFLILILLSFIIYQNIINLECLVFTSTFWLLLLISLSTAYKTFIRLAIKHFEVFIFKHQETQYQMLNFKYFIQ